jgi:hypothetical protein
MNMIVAVYNVKSLIGCVRIDTLRPLYHYSNISSLSSPCDESKYRLPQKDCCHLALITALPSGVIETVSTGLPHILFLAL